MIQKQENPGDRGNNFLFQQFDSELFENYFRFPELFRGIDPADLIRSATLHALTFFPSAEADADHIGEIILPLRIIGTDLLER